MGWRDAPLIKEPAWKQAELVKDTTVQTPTSWQQSVFPSATKIEPGGALKSAARVGMGVVDVGDFLKRGLAHVTGQGDIKDPEANIWAKPRQIWRDYMDEIEQSEKVPEKVPVAGTVPGLTMEQNPEITAKYGKVLGDALFETIGDPILARGLAKSLFQQPYQKIRGIVKGTVEAPRKAAGAGARGLTKIPEETLTKYATKEGRLEMAKAYARETPTAKALVRKVYKQRIPEAEMVDTFIEQANDVPMEPLIKSLEDAKKSIKFKKTNKATIDAIDDLIADYSDMGKTVSAKEFRQARIELDDVLGDVYEKEGLTRAKKVFKDVRRQMKEALVDASPKEYKQVMAEYARKMNRRSDVKEILGKDYGMKAQKKARVLLDNIDRRTKTEEKEVLEAFDDIYGTNFTKRGEAMAEARKIAADPAPPGGKFEASLFPKVATGWGKLGVAVVGLGWPKFSGKILNALSSMEKVVKGGYRLPKKFVTMKEAEKVQALALAMKPMSEAKVDKINQLIARYERTKDPKTKAVIERDINKKLRGGK